MIIGVERSDRTDYCGNAWSERGDPLASLRLSTTALGSLWGLRILSSATSATLTFDVLRDVKRQCFGVESAIARRQAPIFDLGLTLRGPNSRQGTDAPGVTHAHCARATTAATLSQ